MKKALLAVVIVGAAALTLASCSASSGSGLDFVGTWSDGAGSTLVFTATTLSASSSVGTMDGSFTSVDTGAGHIQMTLTAVTGLFAMYPVGTTMYMTYSITGNQIFTSMSSSAYPASATAGPYTKQ